MNQGTTQSVLIVDDEPDIRELLSLTLERMGLVSHCAATLQEARHQLQQRTPDLCLTDMRLPDGNGISLVELIQREYPDLPVAVITAHGSVETAISALKGGAFDFISKPIELERLRSLVQTALKLPRRSANTTANGARLQLVGQSPAMQGLRQQIRKLARSQAPVHIHGESGVGKEVVARLIHAEGPRAEGPFIAVNCGAIPPELMESEFFGHLKGSFTGASRDKQGLFQAAEGGTLFLDEIAELPLPMQVKLLRAIQEKAVRPVGAQSEQATDIRLLSATHRHLASEVEAGRFRNDLFYRINVIDLHIPALREHREDLPQLVEVLLLRLGASEAVRLTPSALSTLQDYAFPGNVRELENMLERALALAEGSSIDAGDLQLQGHQSSRGHPNNTGSGAVPTEGNPEMQRTLDAAVSTPPPLTAARGDLDGYMNAIERQVLTSTIETCGGNKTAAARELGISFRSLRYRLQKLGLDD